MAKSVICPAPLDAALWLPTSNELPSMATLVRPSRTARAVTRLFALSRSLRRMT